MNEPNFQIFYSFSIIFIASLARGFNRGGRGGNQRKTWNTRGGRGGHRDAHRGAQRGASSNTSRGASRGSWSNRGTSQLRENNLGHSYESYPHSSSGPYPAYDSSYEMTSNSNFGNSSYSGSYMQRSVCNTTLVSIYILVRGLLKLR